MSDCFGPATSFGNNLIGDPSGCTMTLQPTDLTGDPGLGPFTDNGTPGNGHFPLRINWGRGGLDPVTSARLPSQKTKNLPSDRLMKLATDLNRDLCAGARRKDTAGLHN